MRSPTAHLIGVLAIVASIGAAVYRSNVRASTFGDDFDVVCEAGNVLAHEGNPYDMAAVAAAGGTTALPLTYPPLAAIVVRPACGRIAPWWLVLGGIAALAALTARLPGVRAAPAAWAIVAGCAAFPWLVLTGNVMALVEGFCGLAATWAIARSRPATFGAALGIAAFLKLMPAAYLVAAFVRWPVRSALASLAAAAAVFGALELTTYGLVGGALAEYWTAVGTGWNGFVAEELRFGSENNPSMFSFLPIASAYAGLGSNAGYVIAAVIALLFAAAWFRAWLTYRESDDSRLWLSLLVMGVIAVSYPRFKPYSMVFMLPAMAMIFARLREKQLRVALVAACLLPNVALIGMTWLATAPPMPTLVVFALQYAQWMLVAFALALALTPRVVRQLTADTIA